MIIQPRAPVPPWPEKWDGCPWFLRIIKMTGDTCCLAMLTTIPVVGGDIHCGTDVWLEYATCQALRGSGRPASAIKLQLYRHQKVGK